MKNALWICAAFLWMLAGCEKAVADLNSYAEWAQKNRSVFVKKIQTDGLILEVQYRPTELILAQETSLNQLNEEEFANRLEELQGVYFFNLKLDVNRPDQTIFNYELGEETIEKRKDYLLYQMQKDVALIEGKDTLACSLYHFESTYNATKSKTIVLSFETKNTQEVEGLTLSLNSRFLGSRPIAVHFPKEELEKIPTLNFKK